jgi:hypothetical protein
MRTIFILTVAIAANMSAQDKSWDGPLLPVDSTHAILNVKCAKAQSVIWSDELERSAHGLEPGERVWMLVPDAAVAVTLGDPVCVVGEECHGAWVSLRLSPKATRNAIAVVPRRFLTDEDPVSAPRQTGIRKGACADPPHMSWTATMCTEWDLGWKGFRLEVQSERTLVKETGWDLIRTHVRVLHRLSGDSGRWQMISEGVDELTPRAVLPSEVSCRVLWRKEEGIGAPALITVQLSRVDADGSQVFGRKYWAGGQPCD